jgi:hypothetical protein
VAAWTIATPRMLAAAFDRTARRNTSSAGVSPAI